MYVIRKFFMIVSVHLTVVRTIDGPLSHVTPADYPNVIVK